LCRNCGKIILVPPDAIMTGESPSILKMRLMSQKYLAPRIRLTIADKIKRKYKRIELWIGFVSAVASTLILEPYIINTILRYLVSYMIGNMVTITISALRKEEEESTPKSELERSVET